jgi:transcriptional regulator with XRE-family HTH domain
LTNSLGQQIAAARKEKGKSLRALAEEVDLSPSYLNDIEHDRRVPAEKSILDLARVLSLDSDTLLAKAGRVGEDAEQYLRATPSAGVLLRKVSSASLSEEDLQRLIRNADKIIQDRNTET